MTTSCPRCRQCLAISTQSRCRPPPGKSFMMANAIRIEPYADRAAKTPVLKLQSGAAQAFDHAFRGDPALSPNWYIGADPTTRAPRARTELFCGGAGHATPVLRPRAGQVRFNPPSRGSILPVNSWINSDEANDTDRMVPAENCIWLENRPGLH